MNKVVFLALCMSVVSGTGYGEPDQISCGPHTYHCYPATLETMPQIPSPLSYLDGSEWLVVRVEGDRYAIVPVTVENGEPWNCKERQWGKGRQLEVDGRDFPTLVDTGLHSDRRLALTETITGRPVAQITKLGQPEALSGAGFLAQEEDIISVLRCDNQIVSRMGLTHRQLARRLFHLWNLVLGTQGYERRFTDLSVLYDDKWIAFRCEGSRGWQESIFDDEILGMFQFEVTRSLEPDEKSFLEDKYADLTKQQMDELIEKLTHFHTGEMVPFYAMRYGFYEGHTSYRADPIAIARIFGLKSLQQIEAAFPGRLHEILTGRFTPEFVTGL